jgi:hypothetical protein
MSFEGKAPYPMSRPEDLAESTAMIEALDRREGPLHLRHGDRRGARMERQLHRLDGRGEDGGTSNVG